MVDARIARKTDTLIENEVFGQLPRSVRKKLGSGHVGRLKDLQHAIYALDVYGETHAKLDESEIERLEREIARKAHAFGFNGIKSELKHLRKYREFEQRMHEGYKPTFEEGLAAMKYKSSDVALLKRIALNLAGDKKELKRFKVHRRIAAFREILDDAKDYREDANVVNYNLFRAPVSEENKAVSLKLKKLALTAHATGKHYERFYSLARKLLKK